MTTTAEPLSTAELEAALRRLPAGRPAEAALMLALPVDQIVGIHARSVGRWWTWRGGRVEAGSVANAELLVVLNADDATDRFVDVTAEPTEWVRIVRSGAYLVCFGSDVLLDLPLLRIAPELEDRAREILVRVACGDLDTNGDGQLAVRVAAGGWFVTPRT